MPPLLEQTGRFTAWANDKQNSRLVNFVPESRLPFLHKSVLFSKNGRERLKLVSKVTLKKWNTDFRLKHSYCDNRTTLQEVPLLLEICHLNDPNSRVLFTTFQPEFLETFVNG